MTDRHFSFEFSAPRTEAATAKLLDVHERLKKETNPSFFSVTYGAGGSTRDGTKDAVLRLKSLGTDVAPHLSFGTDTEEKIEGLILEYQRAGINRVVALRGDMPSGTTGAGHIRYAADLVRFIREKTGDHFIIEVACYPEIHPDSKSVDADLRFFKAKVDAGANSAITQYFYNADAYFRYVDACQKLGVDIPIVPGIMPITNFASLIRFSDKCGAEIPRWIRQYLHSYENDPESLKTFATETVSDLCRRLLDGGAPGLHFYTLNQSLPSLRIWRNLGL